MAFINAATPFKVTAIENGTFAAGTTWYTMAIGTGGKIISDNDGAEHIALGRATTQYEDCDLWCFVGNDTDGYAIYNKQAGPTKVLASHTTMSNINGFSGTGGSTYPTMQPANELPAGYIGLWDFTSTDKIENVDGYIMKIHGTDYAVNNFGNRGMLAFGPREQMQAPLYTSLWAKARQRCLPQPARSLQATQAKRGIQNGRAARLKG